MTKLTMLLEIVLRRLLDTKLSTEFTTNCGNLITELTLRGLNPSTDAFSLISHAWIFKYFHLMLPILSYVWLTWWSAHCSTRLDICDTLWSTSCNNCEKLYQCPSTDQCHWTLTQETPETLGPGHHVCCNISLAAGGCVNQEKSAVLNILS